MGVPWLSDIQRRAECEAWRKECSGGVNYMVVLWVRLQVMYKDGHKASLRHGEKSD